MDALKQPQAPPPSVPARPFLPQESPLSMLPCRLDHAVDVRRSQALTSASLMVRRLFIFAGTALLTLAGGYGMYDVVKVGGVTFLEALLLGLFLVLLAWVAFSFMSALAGFFVLLTRGQPSLPDRHDRSAASHHLAHRDAAADL